MGLKTSQPRGKNLAGTVVETRERKKEQKDRDGKDATERVGSSSKVRYGNSDKGHEDTISKNEVLFNGPEEERTFVSSTEGTGNF